MDLRSLHYFSVVAEELNFTRAAEKLNMSQPPLSNQIKNLEEELGVTLFIRGNRSLQLTDAGKVLLRRSAELLDLADRTREEISSLNNGLAGTLLLGIVESRAPFLAGEWIKGFREEYPLVEYYLWNGSSDEVIDQIHRGIMELGIIAAPYDSEHLEGIPVGSEAWVAIISKEHPLAKEPGDTIPLSKLTGEALIVPHRRSRVDAIRKWFKEAGAEPNIVCEQSNFIDALALSKTEVGISIFPQTTPAPMAGVVSKFITNPPKKADYYLVWHKEHSLSELAQTFIDYVSDYLLENPADAPGVTEDSKLL